MVAPTKKLNFWVSIKKKLDIRFDEKYLFYRAGNNTKD